MRNYREYTELFSKSEFSRFMSYQIKRTLKEVLNFETGEPIDADTFFLKPLDEIHLYRSELQKAINNERDKLFVCYYCKQLIRIRGGIAGFGKRKIEAFHFAHLKDSDDCHIKTKSKFSKEEYDAIKYNGAKESPLHIDLKEKIAECLNRNSINNLGISKLEVEKVIKSQKIEKEWKKPDINAIFNEKRIAIELQLSTTWLDVITKRQHFYKEEKIFIFWIFHNFDIDDESRKLTYNDVIYTNNQNAFIFDYETYQKSIEENDLVLKCYYKTYTAQYLNIKEDWALSFVKLSDLIFDENNYKIYYYDSNARKKEVDEEIQYLQEQYDERNRQLIREEKQREKQLEEEKRLKLLREKEKQRKIDERNDKIKDVEQSIQELTERKSALEKSILKIDMDLENYLLSISNIEEYTSNVIEHANNRTYFTRFFKEREITDLIDSNTIDKAIEAMQQIDNSEKEIKDKLGRIKNCQDLPSIVVNSKKFHCLDPKTSWDFIQKNKSQVFILSKKHAYELFAGNELKPILTHGHFDGLRYSNEFLILFDFSERIKAYNSEINECRDKINKNQQVLAIQKSLINETITKYYQTETIKLDNRKIVEKEDIDKIELKIENLLNSKKAIFSEPLEL